ncbi:MAG: universal stress protein, partial [Phenylobacterium sp.]
MLRKVLVIADDSPEFAAALKFACRRARAAQGHVALLRVIE